MINLIWAMDESYLAGKDDLIPWHIKGESLNNDTNAKSKKVLMGYNYYLVLKDCYKEHKFPFSEVFVATSDSNLQLEDAVVITDVASFLKDYPKNDELWVIGGHAIYSVALPLSDNVYIPHID